MNVKMHGIVPVAALVGLFTTVSLAQTPSPAAPGITITATSANVSGAGEKIEFFINKWSTDADRDKLSTAWNTKPAPPPAAGTRAGADGAPAAGRAGGGGGRGGRGGAAADATPRTPEAALAAAMKEMTPVGYFWTSEVGGYLVRYASKVPGPAGETRLILLTDKRLGAAKNGWQPGAGGGAANTYEFSLIELRVPAKGDGEGKASLTGAIVVDPDTKGLGLENYDTLPVTLRGVKMRTES